VGKSKASLTDVAGDIGSLTKVDKKPQRGGDRRGHDLLGPAPCHGHDHVPLAFRLEMEGARRLTKRLPQKKIADARKAWGIRGTHPNLVRGPIGGSSMPAKMDLNRAEALLGHDEDA
jgi:hypothetical protein